MARLPLNNGGYLTLISLLIVSAIGMAVTLTLITGAFYASRMSALLLSSSRARALATACAQEALQQIRNSTNFTGSGNLSLDGGTCAYNVVNDGGQNRTITASGNAGNTVRRVKITINNINPTINVTSWQEVADF